MLERDMWWKIVLVGVLIALSVASVMPLEQKIKRGIDLAGGYSLLYELDDAGFEGTDKTGLSQRVIEVLRRRVDPKGVYNLVWRAVGSNRIEIQMPAPSKNIQETRKQYEELQQKLQDTILRRSTIVAAVSNKDNRAETFEKLAMGIASRPPLLQAAAKAYDDMQAMSAVAADPDKTRNALLAALNLPAEQRATAFAPIIDELPDRKEPIDALVKAYDEYQAAQAASQPATTQPAQDDVTARRLVYEAALQRVVDVSTDRSVALESAFDTAIGAIVATNIDINRLQAILEMKPKDPERRANLDALMTDHPGLADLINRIVEKNDELRDTRRRGEGRLEDPADLQRLLKGAGVLEFRIIPTDATNPTYEQYREDISKRGIRSRPGEESYQWFEIEDVRDFLNIKTKEDLRRIETDFDNYKMGAGVVIERFGDKYYVLSHIGEGYTMTHTAKQGESDWSLVSALPERDANGAPAIGFRLDTAGGTKFGPLTRTHRGKQLAIFIDDQCVSHARINEPITTSGIIQGRFTMQEVNDMVKKLNAGSLPQKLKDPPISVRAIGPTLGEANQDAGLKAGIIGAACVALFMFFWYRYAGGVAMFAVAVNILFTFAMMAILGATLTMPGIAGLVLAIGMGVDANVLINERIREELNRGTALRMAVKLGYERAFSAILDGNVTTLLTCIILYAIGSEQIKGFGLTLGIGVFINVFTAYFITRMFFEMMSMISVPREVKRNPLLIGLAVTAAGALLYGIGYALNTPENRDASSAIAFGNSLIYVGPSILLLLAVMMLARAIHGNRKTIPMAVHIGVPNINWIAGRKAFFAVSAVLIGGSAALFFFTRDQDLYDIEFLGGVNAQIDLKEGSSIANLTTTSEKQAEIENRLAKSAEQLRQFSVDIQKANISGASGTYTLATPGIPAARLAPFLRELLDEKLVASKPIGYSDSTSEVLTVHLKDAADLDGAKLKADLAARIDRAAGNIASPTVQAISGIEAGQKEDDSSFTVVTRETIKDVVIDAIVENMRADLNIQQALDFKLAANQGEGGVPYFPIRESNPKALGVTLSDTEAASLELQGWEGGVAMVLEGVTPPQDIAALQGRLKSMRLQPDFERYGWRQSKVFGLTPSAENPNLYSRLLVIVTDENYPMLDERGNISVRWQERLALPEVELIQAALQRQESLNQVTQFDPEVSSEAKAQAYVALALSWIVIIAYLWFRFGSVRWGTAAVIALVHDATVAVGAVALTAYISRTPIGPLLLINEAFRIDLPVVAALLTIIGFSVNDTIVIFDRIRENRGRMKDVTVEMVNTAVNQTMARTILTSLTALMTVFIMYVWGGRGIHSINFTLMIGMLSGIYSTVAISSQFILRRDQRLLAKA